MKKTKEEKFVPFKKAFDLVREKYPDLNEKAVRNEIRRSTHRENGEKALLPHRRSSPCKKARISIKVSTLMGYAETLYQD